MVLLLSVKRLRMCNKKELSVKDITGYWNLNEWDGKWNADNETFCFASEMFTNER